MSEFKGNFDVAIHSLINKLAVAENGLYQEDLTLQEFAEKVLKEWDEDRGEDWYTSTTKRDNKND